MRARYFSTFELMLLALLASLVVVAKIAIRTPMQLPGHTGLIWMAVVIVAAGVVRKPGAVSLLGVTSGLIAAFLGMGDFGALNTFLSYTAVGIGTDLALLLLGSPENLAAATLAGAIGHTGKFLVKWAFGIIAGAPVGFLAFGLARSVIGYIVFGALGGLLGGLTLIALRKAGFFSYLEEKR